jgi:hypothetical protein
VRVVLYVLAVLHVVWGLFALLLPERAAEMLGFVLLSLGSLAEMRATYGGMFIVIGYLIFLAPTRPEGVAWLRGLGWVYGGVALCRVVSLTLDGWAVYTAGVGLFEAATAALLHYAAARVVNR